MTPDFQPTAAYDPVSGTAPTHAPGAPPAWMSATLGCLGRWAAWTGAFPPAPDPTLIDSGTGLYSRKGLMVRASPVLAACRRDHRPVSVAVFDCSDLLEVRSIYGSTISRRLMALIARKLAAVAGRRGIVARSGAAQFTLVLPGLGRDKAEQAMRRVLGTPSRIEFDAGDSEIVLIPEVLIEAVGDHGASLEDVYLDLCKDLAQMREREQRRCHYLQRERERHSRPMGLGSARSAPAPLQAA